VGLHPVGELLDSLGPVEPARRFAADQPEQPGDALVLKSSAFAVSG